MSMKDTNFRTVVKLFSSLDKNGKCILEIAKETDITPVHLYNKIRKNDFKGLITTRKVGRKRIVKLTLKGELVKKLLEKLGNVIDM